MVLEPKPLTRLSNWTVERSGAGLRVTGTDADGKAVKLTNIRRVEREHDVTAAFSAGVAGPVILV